MAAPIHKYKHILKANNVRTFSCNFQLYGDFSKRVMSTIKQMAEDVEIYSIDEAFLDLSKHNSEQLTQFGTRLRNTIKQWTGIPTSVGIGPSKTLAKLTNEIAKKNPEYEGVLDYSKHPNPDQLLEKVEVGDIWGIGRQYAKLLKSWNIYNARQLRDSSEQWAKQYMSVLGMRTIYELRGIPCIPMHEGPSMRKSIVTSRSFGHSVTRELELKEAVASYVCRAGEKLRQEKLAAQYVTVFIHTNKHSKDQQQYNSSYTITLNQASAYNPKLIEAALAALRKIYLDGYYYKKAGVVLTGLIPFEDIQLDFFNDEDDIKRRHTIMNVFDNINTNYGKRSIRYAATGTKKQWSMKQDMRSPRYTTNWNELMWVGG